MKKIRLESLNEGKSLLEGLFHGKKHTPSFEFWKCRLRNINLQYLKTKFISTSNSVSCQKYITKCNKVN